MNTQNIANTFAALINTNGNMVDQMEAINKALLKLPLEVKPTSEQRRTILTEAMELAHSCPQWAAADAIAYGSWSPEELDGTVQMTLLSLLAGKKQRWVSKAKHAQALKHFRESVIAAIEYGADEEGAIEVNMDSPDYWLAK